MSWKLGNSSRRTITRSSSARIAGKSASTACTQGKSWRANTGRSPTRENFPRHHSTPLRNRAIALPKNPLGGFSSLPLTLPRPMAGGSNMLRVGFVLGDVTAVLPLVIHGVLLQVSLIHVVRGHPERLRE